jgi:hypothetical protein
VVETSADDDPCWPDKATSQSWHGEGRPAGSWLADAADVTAAAGISGAGVGDYYFDAGSQLLRELTNVGTPAADTIYRGGKAKMPRTPILVPQSGGAQDNLVIFDGDVAAGNPLPAWMVFDADTSADDVMRDLGVLMARMSNGWLVCALFNQGGVVLVHFPSDQAWRYDASGLHLYNGTISERNDAKGWTTIRTSAAYQMPSDAVRAVALYVDPIAPADSRTGMRRPVIACPTAAGLAVIREDGTVTSTGSIRDHSSAVFLADGTLVSGDDLGRIIVATPPEWRASSFAGSVHDYGSNYDVDAMAALAGSKFAIYEQNTPGLRVIDAAGVDESRFDDAILASDYALPPFRRSALALALSSTETADLVADAVVNDDFTSYADQAAADAVWTRTDAAVTFDAANDEYDIDGTQGTNVGITKTITTVVGQTYTVQGYVGALSAGAAYVQIAGVTSGAMVGAAPGTSRMQFTATATSYTLRFYGNASFVGTLNRIDVDLAETDRSGNDAGPIAYGTLTRSAVATGAKITAFSGFSVSNYLEHASDHFDPGTGDWSITRAVKGLGDYDNIVDYATYSGGYTGPIIRLYVNASGLPGLLISDDGQASFDQAQGSVADVLSGSEWHVVSGIRRSSTIELWIDGRLVDSSSIANATTSLSGGVATHGISRPLGSAQAAEGQISSIMLDANYAPTAEQIREQHAILRAWHSEDADPTLLSDTVDALAYDDERDLLYVAGPSGTTVLHGSTLTRDTTYTSSDANLTSDDHNAVAGGGGISVIASANEVRFSLPALALRDKLLSARRIARDGIGVQRAATTDATPTVIAAVHVAEGEARTFQAFVTAQEAGDPGSGTEHLLARVDFSLRRPIGGNVEVLGTPTVTIIDETTGSMDVTLAADTSNQLGELTGTGVASTDLVWETEIRVVHEHSGRAA